METRALKDRYGFWFWLRWIVWFAGSFIISAIVWTAFFQFFFGTISGAELTVSWVVAVFGSWFLLVIPFMRKKEQIWKRLNTDQEKAVDISFAGAALFIGLLIVSTVFWDFYLRGRLAEEGIDPVWVKAVFGTWFCLLLPFLIFLYRKADALFKTANERQMYVPNYRQQPVERSKRLLPDTVAAKIRSAKPALPNAHLVTLILKDGQVIQHVFVRHSNEIAGLYNRPNFDFSPSDCIDAKVLDTDSLPPFEEANWTRLDINS